MNSITQLSQNNALPLQSHAGSKVDKTQAGALANSKPSAIEQRVAQLQQNTVTLAQDFMSYFTQQLFGDAAKGMTVSFDQVEVSASSTASAAAFSSQNASGSTSAAAFRLDDSSSFIGRGTLTTADGKQFQFELTVNYQSTQQTSFAQHTSSNTQNTGQSASPLTPRFNGTADDLLNQISADPVKLPFALNQGDEQQGLGEMMLKLLNLAGGDRYFDWQDQTRQQVDQQA